jgi:enoyl-CoA hydratase
MARLGAGGLEIALACDIRIASDNTYLQFPEVARGLIPGLGGTQRLPRMISPAKAAEMIFSGTAVSAEEAYRLGLVNKVVPLAQLLPTFDEWAAKICENGPLAIRKAKEAHDSGQKHGLGRWISPGTGLLRGNASKRGLSRMPSIFRRAKKAAL